MHFYTREEIDNVKKVDLLSYLKVCEPENLVQKTRNTYTTREHDSLSISNGKWFWFSQGIGGYNALDYLRRVRGLSFVDSMNVLTNACIEKVEVTTERKKKKKLILPDIKDYPTFGLDYLIERGIDKKIIEYCIDRHIIYETEKYNSLLFVGYDEKGDVRYASGRGCISDYKGELTGSEKKYSFRIYARKISPNLHVFESAIDLLSYATLKDKRGDDWREDNMLSLGGVNGGSTLPALDNFLDNNPEIKEIHVHLDNDLAGRMACRGLESKYSKDYLIYDEGPIEKYKDFNDQLLNKETEFKKEERC